MICPNYKIKEVFDGFNEIVVALGGKPLTEEEFRSSELRNQRTGVDYSAMEAAYKIYHRNNGNMIDRAPNGEHSILFESLLEHFNDDRLNAIRAKVNVYSDEFFNQFGKWIIPATPDIADEDTDVGEISKDVDENGEPFVSAIIKVPTVKIPEGMMAHMSYQSPSERKSKTNISENKARVKSYYINDQSLLRTTELSILRRKADAERLIGNIIYRDEQNADTEENKKDAVNKKVKEVNKLLGNTGYAYSFRLKGKGDGSMKIGIHMYSAQHVLNSEVDSFVDGMSAEDLYRECMNIELMENEAIFHINPRKIPLIREQILKKSFLHKDDPDLVDRTIEFLKSLPNTQDDNALVECIVKWVKNDTIDAYRDFDKIRGLFTIARKHGMDVQRFKSPFELLDAVLHLESKEDAKPITNFNKYKHIHFSNTEIINGVEVQVYDVDNTEDGQKDVCQMLADSNPKVNGKALDFSPWCLSTFTIRNGVAVPSPSAQRFWNTYNRGNRQIAVVNGFPIAFNSSSNPGDFWWDYYDSPASTGKLLDLNFTSREEILKQKIESEGSALYHTFGPYRVDDTEIIFHTWELSVHLYKPTNHINIFVNGDKVLSYRITENGLVDGDFEYYAALYISSKLNSHTKSVHTLLHADHDFYNDLEDLIIKLKNLKIESVPFDLKSIKSIAYEFLLLYDEQANKIKDEDIYFKQPKEIPTPQLSDLEYMTLEEVEEFFPENVRPGTQDPVMIDRLSAEEAAREIIEDDYLWRQYEKYLALPVRDRLQAKLHAILRKYHFEIIEDDLQEIFGQDVLGMFDYLNKVVYLSNTGNANAISDAEEFSHAFIKMMGSSYHLKLNRSKYPHGALYSKLRDLLVQTDFYKHVYEEYKDVYTFEDGTPNLPKIKEEAMGKALAAILNDRWEVHHEANKSFFNTLKLWFNNMLKWVKHLLTKHNAKAVDNLQYELEKIADSIIDGSYAKKYLDTVDKSKTRQVSLHESFLKSIDEDGGVAIRILLTLQQLGGVVSGSMSYRNQTPVFRKNADALHDLDVAFPLSMHGLHNMFERDPRRYPSLYYVGPNNYFNQRVLEAAFSANPAVNNIFQTMQQEYPGFLIMYAYPASGNVVVNCIICEDQSLVDRFKSLEGSFDRRLSHFTKEERNKMRLVDMFFNKNSAIQNDFVTEDEYGLHMANYKHSFKEKMKYSRAKDLFDYQNLDPINRIVYSRENPVNVTQHSLMAHIGSTTSFIDQIRKSAEDIRHRFGVLYKAYQKMPNKSASRQKLANEIFEVYNEIKRLDNFEAVTNALEFARKRLGLTDDSSVRGVLLWLQDNESDNFARVSAEQIVDVMQNSIGFFENLLTYFPSDCYMTEEARLSRAVVTDGIRNKIRPLWVKAVYAIGDRIVDELVDRWFTGQDEDRAGMKEVAKDWLHKNAMYSDISNIAAFLLNYQYSENPITKLVFHLIQVADTKTGIELQPIAAKVTKAYRKANRGKLSPSWQKIFMEFDKDGIPTGNFVRDINYGQYQKDVDEFITELNKEFQDKYGHSYYIDEDGTYINSLTGGFADDEVWNGNIPPHIIEYKLAIEEFKCDRANRRYTFEYYKERMSEPYTGPDPLLTNTTGEFKHGLSPRTLSRYERIQSNINYYMSLCYNKEDGKSHPEDLSPEDWIKLEQWRQYLDDLSNPYNEDGSTKTGEDYQTAIEIRAWEKWIGLKLDTQVDMESFEAEALKILAEKGPIAYDKFVKYNSRVGINPNLISQTIKQFGVTDIYADAVHARLLRTSLQRLVNSKHGYGRELGKLAKNPQFWQECRRTDQLIEDCKTKRGRDFAEMMEKTFANDLIEYRDAYGNAYDYFGRVVPRDQEKNTNLLTWYDYMVNSYVSEIMSSPTRTIEGLYDGSGNLIIFSGSEADVKAAVKQFFTYRRSSTLADGTVKIERVPLSIFSLLTPLQDTFVNQNTGNTENSITNIPSGRFSNKVDQTGKYLTDPTVFDNSSHIAELPKREYYDNSDAFNAMSDDERALYDILVETCANTLKLYRQNSAHFNWRLPMVNAQSMALLSRLKSDGFAKVSRAIFDSITTVEENDENVRTAEQFATNPDGTIATDVPLKFVHPLKDMSRLSTDVASTVILFAEMGLNYKNKQEIDDKIKALRYNLNFDIRNEMELDEDEVSPNEGKNSVQQFDNMTNIHMYGNDWHFKADKDEPYERHIIAAQKATRWLQRYETTHMLGLNILSMLVGACDAFVKQFREVLNGKYARPQDMVKGLWRCIEHTPMVIKNINNPLANNKFTALMQMLRISKGTRATYEHMNWGRIKKFGAQFLMGGFSMLDYMMNGLLLMTHMSNVRLYEGDSQVPKGFYTLYELQQLFVKTGRTKWEATLKHLTLHEDLYNAFEFISGEGTCVIKPEYMPYINDDTLTMIRTKTLSRGALYNGMNPDNDQPQARKKVWSAMALSMRGWLTQAYQHLMSGGTDNIVINRDKIEDTVTRYGITKKSVLYKKKSITNLERSRRQAWNYETGTPQDQIFVGLYRGFGTLIKYLLTNAFRNIPEGDPRKVKFSDVEKYAAKDAIIYLAILGAMLATWPIVNSAAAAAPPPDKDDTKLLDNPYDYIMDVYIPNQYWKLQAADIYFRTIESSISSVDPTTALDFITSLTVLKSGFDEQLGLIKMAGDLTGLSGHDISEILKRGGYKYYTRGQRALAKGFGFPDNIHTAFDYYGLYSNMDFYLSKYGGIYKFWGYDWREEWKKDKKTKNNTEAGPQAGPNKRKNGNFGPGPSKKKKKNNSGIMF